MTEIWKVSICRERERTLIAVLTTCTILSSFTHSTGNPSSNSFSIEFTSLYVFELREDGWCATIEPIFAVRFTIESVGRDDGVFRGSSLSAGNGADD